RGGCFRFLTNGEAIRGRQQYMTNTNVLRTEFTTDDAAWEVIDFAPRVPLAGGRFDTPLELVRMVRPLGGTPRISIEFTPRPDDGLRGAGLLATQHGVEVLDTGAPMHLYTNVPGDYIVNRTEVAVRRPLYFMLAYGHRPAPPTEADVNHAFTETTRGWRLW